MQKTLKNNRVSLGRASRLTGTTRYHIRRLAEGGEIKAIFLEHGELEITLSELAAILALKQLGQLPGMPEIYAQGGVV